MEFQNWLKTAIENNKFGDTPEADFANDAVADKNFRDFKKWDELETYIVFRGACREAIRAAKRCFTKWQVERAK